VGVPYSRVSIISNALLLLGKPRIESIAAGGPPAIAADQLFDMVLSADLSSPNWRFATSIAKLSLVAGTDITFANYRYAYQLPADLLAIWRIWPGVSYQVFGQRLYTSTSSELQIEYRSAVSLGNMPPSYLNYFTYLLADTLSAAMTQDASVISKINTQMLTAKSHAMVVNAQNHPNQAIASSPWIAARLGGGGASRLG